MAYTLAVRQPRTLTVDGIELALSLERKRVKNVNARHVGRQLPISAPTTIPDHARGEIVVSLARRLLRRVRSRELNAADEALALARRIAARFPQPIAVAEVGFVTTQRSRWGSYSRRTGTIRLHAALRQMPAWVLEAVVAHELAHVVHLDHSPAFWALVRRVCPATDRANAFLDGVSWLARHLDELPAIERAQLVGEEE